MLNNPVIQLTRLFIACAATLILQEVDGQSMSQIWGAQGDLQDNDAMTSVVYDTIHDQIKLQIALDQRTREVVQQKELLEISNKDITDSIRYAKNIQQAMLPSHSLLRQHFPDAFIYFKPRDIVSGDFYTIARFEDIVVVSCADCTGHGVPGVFMSLIGSTILKEVSNDKTVQNSGQALIKLDHRLREMLTREGSTAVSDGMDISIFDYNTRTRKLQLASANRSTFLHHKGQWIEIKGDRRNVGGQGVELSEQFNIHTFDIEPGDRIYMFSDGITDQFGGPLGKKIKRAGLLEWLKSIHDAPMSQQREYIKSAFKDWKGTYEQTDDVIIMGIQV